MREYVLTYYLRSTVLGGQVVAEISGGGGWSRGYVYLGGQMLAIQSGGVSWVHQDPVTKSQRITNSSGTVTSTIDVDPWGGETASSSNQAFQPHRFTSYERDGNGGDEAMMRRYSGKWHRFDQPDPDDGSYDLTNPQSFNRYAYVQNDPVNWVDPTGLLPMMCGLYMQYMNGERTGNGFVCFGDSEPFFGFNPGDKPLGGPGEPQKPAPTPTPPTDCQKFADMMQQIANNASDVQPFLDKLASTFTAANNASIGEMRRAAGLALPAGRPTFGASGFKPQFQDPSNQVRHFVGGFIAGADLGVTAGLLFMNQREEPNPNHENDPDIRLNGISTDMGARYGANFMVGIGTIRREMVDEFRHRVCQ
jgi:RHS repeat-associated protein